MPGSDSAPVAAAARALEFITDGMVVGLGTGRAATAFVRLLADRVRAGLRVRGVPTSDHTAELARGLGIPLTSLDEVEAIDLTVDGADEVDPANNLIKGYGGALVREKVVAACSKRVAILVGEEKLVPVLGSRGKLPVEVLPFAVSPCGRWLGKLGLAAAVRTEGDQPFVTDNGNRVLDCRVGPIANAVELERSLLALPGIVGTGLFLHPAVTVLVQRGEQVEVRPVPA